MNTYQKIVKYLAIALAVIIILGIVCGIASAFVSILGLFGSATLDESKTYEVSENITSLELELGAADFYIKSGDAFSVESNLKYLAVSESDGTLKIKEKNKLNKNYNDATFTLTVPQDFVFDEADITAGAGKVTVERLAARELTLVLGAGEAVIRELISTGKADITGGAGEVTVSGASLTRLELEIGVGELNLTGELLGNSNIDLGIGEVNITLLGGRDAYSLDIEKGIGSIEVDGEDISGNQTLGDGEHVVDISGGIGAINIEFGA